jgi:peptidoglycan/LPS O-acetylase OafA/YrhL
VEEQFYVIWAPVMLLLLRLRRHVATLIAAGIAVVALLDPYLWSGSNFNRLYFGTDTRCAALFCGAVCAFIAAGGGWRRLRDAWWAPVMGAALIVVLVWSNVTMHDEGRPWLWCTGLAASSVAWALGVAYLAERPKRLAARLLSLDLVVAIGQRSYALYLWSYVMNTWLRDTGNFESVLVIVTTFIAAEISYRFVEVPMLRKKHRFSSVHPTPVPAVAAAPVSTVEPQPVFA